jgi:hypothetical protein
MKALTSLARFGCWSYQRSKKALTSLARLECWRDQQRRKALTSLAAAEPDILPRFARSDSGPLSGRHRGSPFQSSRNGLCRLPPQPDAWRTERARRARGARRRKHANGVSARSESQPASGPRAFQRWRSRYRLCSIASGPRAFRRCRSRCDRSSIASGPRAFPPVHSLSKVPSGSVVSLRKSVGQCQIATSGGG